MLIASTYLAQDVQIRQPLTSFTVVAKPLLNYTSMGFQVVSMSRDVWNESFEGSLTAKNHYWYGGGTTISEGTVKRNSTLDSGFEEVSSSSLNPNMSLPSWFIHRDSSSVTVKVDRSSTIKYHQSYSAYVETRFVNTSTQQSYSWKTPNSIYGSCGGNPFNTIDDILSTDWVHSVQERHWVIYDLGQSYVVKKVRVYCGSSDRIDDIDIYVSDDPQNFGSKLVELWDPVNGSNWSESPSFYKQGRYVKMEFGTTDTHEKLLAGMFYEFDAYIQTSAAGHVAGGLKCPQDYYVRIPYVYLNGTPVLEAALFLDDAGVGSGYSKAFYILADVEIQNGTLKLHIIYVVPVTALGTPSKGDFTNTTNTKYIYNVTTISTYDVWVTFTRNIRNDYQSIWGQVYNAKVSQMTIKNDFYNPQTDSETNTPFMKTYYDAVSLRLSSQGNEEELPNRSFEAPGWTRLQVNKLQSFNHTKDSQDSKEGTTSFFMNVTCDTSGGSGSGFNSTKHGVVAIEESSFIRQVNDTNNQRLHGFIKVSSTSAVGETAYSYVAMRMKFVSLSNPADIRYLYYCVMLYGNLPSDSSTEKYVELVKFYTMQTGIWYEISRRPIVDSGWKNIKITQIALIVAFYYGQTYSSTNKANVVVRFDDVGIDIEKAAKITIRNSRRSSERALDGSYSLKQNKTLGGAEFDVYECGAENLNNTFYVAFPYYANFSIYYYVSSLQDGATIQVSLAIDDGPNYGPGYLYELVYYYGSSSGVSPVFISEPKKVVQVSPSITTLSWVHLQRNWTIDLPGTWPLTNPRIEAVGFRIWTSNSITMYWDVAAFHGKWYGVEKIVKLQSINDILLKKFNTTDYWNITGSLDPGTDDFVDNNSSDVDSSPGSGSHSNFTNEQHGPDFKYDVLTEKFYDRYFTNVQDYVDNNVSNVDGFPSMGSHSNFTAEKYGPDSIYDILRERYLGPGVNINDYVDNNSSDVDGSPSIGIHSNFTAMQYGPDAIYDILREKNVNPPPNNVNDYVDNNVSDVDGSPSVGSHSNFTAMQYGPDSVYDTLMEKNTNPPPNNVNDYVDNNSSNVDGVPGRGTHSNFTAMQYGPDSVYDTLTEKFTGTLTNNTEDFVDAISNVDGVPDKGTHSNLTAEMYGPDSIYDVLTEKNTGNGTATWMTPTAVYSKCGEESGYPATNTIDDVLTTEWRHSVSELHWIVYDMGQSMKTTKVRIFTGSKPQEYIVEHMNIYVSVDTTFDESERVVSNWNTTLGGWAVSPSFSTVGRYIKVDHIDPNTPNDQLKLCFYEFDAWTEPNYELDLEVQWTNVKYNETNEQLCMYGGTMGAEDIRVDVWNGSKWVNVLTDLYQGWNNVSVNSYLTSSTFTIRFKGNTETNDTVQDTWQIDAALLHVWTPGVSNYELDLEVQWTNVDYNELNETLCIYTGSLGSESLKVEYWTGDGWSTLLTSLTANSWNNVTVSLTSSTFTIRFKGTLETGDTTPDSWQIDAVLLHIWTPDVANYKLELEAQWTNVDYSEVYEELCIYTGDLTSEKLKVDVWTASGWVTVFTNLTANTWNNVSVSDYLTSSTFTIRFKGSNETGDTVQDSWKIDAALLHLWTLDIPNYKLDLEVQFTNVNHTQENEYLCIRTGNLGSEPLKVQVWVPSGGGWSTVFEPLVANSWNNISVSYWLDSSTFTVRFLSLYSQGDTFQDSYYIDAVLLHVWTIQGYQLDLEVQFTSVDYDEANEYLCIYAGDLAAEDLHVDVWTGSAWVTVFTDLTANSWNNISISSYLNSPTFTIRFKGGYEASEDTVQDSWKIDAALLRVWTFEGYKIDLEVQFTNVDTEWRNGELRIYTGFVGGEGLRVDYWTGSNWVTLISALGANMWNTASIPLNQTVTIRFKGTKEADDYTQDSWQIDAVLLHTWHIYASQVIDRANATSANQWYYKWWGLRKIYVINGTGTCEITANSTSQGILSFYDNDWNPEDDETIYNNDRSGYVKFNVTDFKLTAYGKNIEYRDYVEIRYRIIFCGPLGVFKFTNENRATAASEPDEYGEEYWHTSRKDDGTCVNYIESSSSLTITFLPGF